MTRDAEAQALRAETRRLVSQAYLLSRQLDRTVGALTDFSPLLKDRRRQVRAFPGPERRRG